jgi:microcystin-dependent protein
MSEPFLGEIKMFAGTFAPRGWAKCDGQLLAVSQYDALFSLFGTFYGGDGRTTFGLPDLRGRLPIHMGTGPGLSPRNIGSKGGAEAATLNSNQLPQHSHGPMRASADPGTEAQPEGRVLARSSQDIYVEEDPDETLSSKSVQTVGGGQSHDNMHPFQAINYIVALFGIYPSRS